MEDRWQWATLSHAIKERTPDTRLETNCHAAVNVDGM